MYIYVRKCLTLKSAIYNNIRTFCCIHRFYTLLVTQGVVKFITKLPKLRMYNM